MASPQAVVISDLQGGRNGIDPPLSDQFPDNQAAEAVNVDLSVGSIGGSRAGSDSIPLLGGTAFTLGIKSLFRWVPGGDETLAELWAVDGAGLVKRLRNGTNWADVTLDDPITGDYDKVVFVPFNGKLWLLYKSAQNRAHLFDPTDPRGPRVRRAGMVAPSTGGGIGATSGFSTILNNGAAGAYTGSRYYRMRYIQVNGTVLQRRSEPGGATSLVVPSGAVSSLLLTPIAGPGEGETHYEIEVSTDARVWSVLAGFALGTHVAMGNAYVDTTAITTYGTLAASDLSGMYTLFPAARFGITDNNRIILAGSFLPATETHESRIWLSPVLGSDDKGDDERWRNELTVKTRIDTSEKNGGSITALIGPVNGTFWSTKYRQLWRHAPTSDFITPYLTRQLSSSIGCVSHKGVVMAEDPDGVEVGYFPTHRGYYRIGVTGYFYMGRDIEDIWKGFNGYSKVNLAATVPVHACYHTDEAQLWVWLATGSSDTPNLRLRCDIKQTVLQRKYGLRMGWVVDTGAAASALCSAPFAATIDATMSIGLKPFIGRSDTTIYRCDSDTANTDAGTAYRSYIRTKSVVPADQMTKLFEVKETILVADDSAGTVYQYLIGDFKTRKQAKVALDPDKDESIVIRKFGASMQSSVGAIQVELGDAVETASAWVLHSLTIPIVAQGTR